MEEIKNQGEPETPTPEEVEPEPEETPSEEPVEQA